MREIHVLKEQTTLPRGFIIRDPAGNRYVIEGILGKGGSSAVYLVKERGDKKQAFASKSLLIQTDGNVSTSFLSGKR